MNVRSTWLRTFDAMRRWLALLLLVACVGPLQAAPSPSEAAVKAAFLYRFAEFVDWPPAAFTRPDQPLVIGVSGNEDVAAELEQLVAGRTIGTRQVIARRVTDAASTAGVHILFLGTRREGRLREEVETVGGPVLVVTEQPGGLRAGSVLNFSTEAGRVRFSASLASAEARNLRLSSRLLAVAQAVEGRTIR
jgi:hypothetical protein